MSSPPLAAQALPEPQGPDVGAEVTEADSGGSTAGWICLGVGATVLVASGVMGVMAASQLDDFDCEGSGACRSDDAAAVDDYNRLRTLSTVGYIAGGIAAGAGIYLVLRSDGAADSSKRESLALRVGPGSAALQGWF